MHDAADSLNAAANLIQRLRITDRDVEIAQRALVAACVQVSEVIEKHQDRIEALEAKLRGME